MESNFNLGSLKIVQEHLSNYINSSIDSVSENIRLITVEKKLPTNYESIENLAKSQKTLDMIGLNGLSNVLGLIVEALASVKNVKFDTKKSIEVLKLTQETLEYVNGYLNKIVSTGKDYPTSLYPVYEKLASSLSKSVSIKDLFYPKVEFSTNVPKKTKDLFKTSLVFNEQLKNELINKLKISHTVVQTKLINVFGGIENYGDFSSPEDKNNFILAVKDVCNAFETIQNININKSFYILFAVYTFYTKLISPELNSSYKEYLTQNHHDIKLNLAQFERQFARLIQSVSSMEVGDKATSLKIDDSILKDVVYSIALAINQNNEIRNSSEFTNFASIYPIEAIYAQLFNNQVDSIVFTTQETNNIFGVFYDLRDSFNSFANLNDMTPEFTAGASKTSLLAKKLQNMLTQIPSLATILETIDKSLVSIATHTNTFSEDFKKELSFSLVFAESGLNNYIKPNIAEQINDNFNGQALNVVKRLNASLVGDNTQLSQLPQTHVDDFSQKVEEEKTLSEIFKQVQNELSLIEDTLDYFLRNEGENLEDISKVISPLNKLKGVFSIVGESELISVVQLLIKDWSEVTSEDDYSSDTLKASVALISGLSLYVKAIASNNVNEAEELKANLLKLFYKNNSDLIEATNTTAISIETPTPAVEEVLSLEKETNLPLEIGTVESIIEVPVEIVEVHVDSNAEQIADNESNEDLSLSLPSFFNKKEDTISVIKEEVLIVEQPKLFIDVANDPEIAEVFLEEANEVLSELEAVLSKLAKDKNNQELLKDVRRSFHTLKGSGRMVGLDNMGEAAWMVEQTLNKVMNGELTLSDEIIGFSKEIASSFKHWVEEIKNSNTVTVDLPSIKQKALCVNPNITTHVDIPEVETIAETEQIVRVEDQDIEFEAEQTSFIPEFEAPRGVVNVESVPSFEEVIEEVPVATEETIEVEIVPEVNSYNDEPLDVQIDGVSVSKNLYEIFLEESNEHIEALKSFAHREYDGLVIVDYATMRHAHTLASIAASVNMMLVSELSGKLEDVFQLCLDNEYKLSQNQMSPIRHSVDNFDLLKTNDSTTYISYCDGLIETLTTLQEQILSELATPTKQPVSVDVEALLAKVMESINETLANTSKAYTEEVKKLSEQNNSLSEAIKTMSEKVKSLETKVADQTKEFAERERNFIKALDVNKNDIRIMANIVKKKSELIEAQLSEENTGIQESGELTEFDVDLDKISSGVSVENTEMNLFLSEVGSSIEIPVVNSSQNKFLANHPQAAVIFEDKISSVKDEIDDEILELTILESEEIIEKANIILDEITEEGLEQSKLKEFKRLLHTVKGSSRMAGANRSGMLLHRLESLVDYLETRNINIFEAKELIVKELEKVTYVMKNISKQLSQSQIFWLDNPYGQTDSSATTVEENIGITDGDKVKKDIVQFIRVPTEIVDSAITDAGEIRLTRTSLEEINNTNFRSINDLKSSSVKLLKMLKEVEVQAESQIKSRRDILDSQSAEFDPLEFDRFTRLQELTRFMNETVSDIHESVTALEVNTKTQEATVNQQSIVSNNLLSELMKVRLVPFGSISDRFYKIARNTAKDLNKKVTLEIIGENTEVDKVILDKVISPIEHLLRNSIAHGIELSEIRSAYNKTQAGNITIDISLDGNTTVVKIKDDGAGINTDKVRSVAIEKGLISADVEYSKDEIINLIFQSGFSTADTVSQVAGRGVGMDVVKSEITSLGGSIKVSTTQNEGSEFTLILPMSIATNQATLCIVKNKLVAIPAVLVEQIDSIKEPALKEAYSKNSYNFGGVDYPFYYVGHLLGLNDKSVLPDFRTYNNIILVKYVDETVVLHVDKVITTTDILIKSLGGHFSKIDGVLGATILGDGQQGIVINPLQLTKYYDKVLSSIVSVDIKSTENKAKQSSRKTVMVVDDSITVRRASSKVLERNNYNVILAKDGEDALEQLQVAIPDIILSDIEMPRMDGFEFVKNVRNVEKYRNIPIIMITSRTADKHKNYAFELGANDFLGKPYKEEDLIEKIQLQLENVKETTNV